MRNLIILFILVFTAIAALQVASMRTKNQTSHHIDQKLHVVASFYPMYFLASRIGGRKAEIVNLTPSSVEPHDYEPTTRDVARMTTSDMLVINGGKLEPWADKITNQLQGSHVLIVTAGDKLANQQTTEDDKTIPDPHVWLDPVLAKEEAKHIEKGFEEIDQKDASYFQQNENMLEHQLDQLDTEYRQGLAVCQKKDFVTAHAAFGYLAKRYGLNQIAISGISPDEEPSTRKLAEVTDLVKKNQINVIFFESLVSPKLSQTIANETGAKTMVLDPIEGISDDDLTRERTYFTMMKDNLQALEIALECQK